MTTSFDPNKYLGTWYELMHYPSWFQRNDNYNTTAEYTTANLNGEIVIQVHNSTITQGKKMESTGIGRYLGGSNFRVDFAINETNKLQQSGQFTNYDSNLNSNIPNYVIDRIWADGYGQYILAVVTDPSLQTLYVLSRFKHPPLSLYNEVMTYVVANFDRDRLVQTPHFE